MAARLVMILGIALLTLVPSRMEARPPLQEQYREAVSRLQTVNALPKSPVDGARRATRADLVSLLVAVAGLQWEALFLAGTAPFDDVGEHQAAGAVAVAYRREWVVGFPDGLFRPDGLLGYNELLTILVRFFGYSPAGVRWPADYLRAAERAGIIDPKLERPRIVDPAPLAWGSVIVLADQSFMCSRFPSDQRNVYQLYHPTLNTPNPVDWCRPAEPLTTMGRLQPPPPTDTLSPPSPPEVSS